uniref:Uncharacterized protein n=1 Tax=Thermosporothrix sp. COM3 TaxID=2490863 RepID=A0A455SS08_9CHLR|nr:hypothetical protein KTC_46420 [Thermosporothrix sp. COM3]
MNATLCTPDIYKSTNPLQVQESQEMTNSYATEPMLRVSDILKEMPRTHEREAHRSEQDEIEEMYSEFEEAISRRSGALRLALMNTDALQRTSRRVRKTVDRSSLYRTLITAGIAFNCLLLGFDLMGLLVLLGR